MVQNNINLRTFKNRLRYSRERALTLKKWHTLKKMQDVFVGGARCAPRGPPRGSSPRRWPRGPRGRGCSSNPGGGKGRSGSATHGLEGPSSICIQVDVCNSIFSLQYSSRSTEYIYAICRLLHRSKFNVCICCILSEMLLNFRVQQSY